MTPLIWLSEAAVARESFAVGVWCWRGTAAARRCFDLGMPPVQKQFNKRAQHLFAIGWKTAAKIHHAEKTLQLFDVLRGWAEFNFGGVISRGGRPCHRNRVAKNFQRRCCKVTCFKFMARSLVARAVKKAFRWQSCVCLSGESTCESSMYANTPSRPSVVRSITLWKVCAALDSPNGMNKYSNRPNGLIIVVFWMSAASTGIWW